MRQIGDFIMKYGLDNFISDSKNAFDKLSGKANEALNTSKVYVEKAQLRVKLKEKYYELGKMCYKMHKDDSDETGSMKMLIKEIKSLEAQLEYAEEASAKSKTCGACGTKNSVENSFCSHCGGQL